MSSDSHTILGQAIHVISLSLESHVQTHTHHDNKVSLLVRADLKAAFHLSETSKGLEKQSGDQY